MRYGSRMTLAIGFAGLMVSCGIEDMKSTSGVSVDPRSPVSRRFEAREVLELMSEVGNGVELTKKTGLSAQRLDAAFENLNGKLQVESSSRQLKFKEIMGSPMTTRQSVGLSALQSAFNQKLQEGAITLVPSRSGGMSVAPGEGGLAGSGIGPFERVVRGGGSVFEGPMMLMGDTASPDHRVGDGRWSWSLSYRWWGVRLSVNHNFLNYLCNNTEWLLSRAGLPTWIKYVLRPIGCLLHAADTGHDGSSISISWAGAFWYSA